jgi:membrane fusion protein
VETEAAEPLFRPEASEARRQRVEGEIVLTQPVAAQALVLLLCAVAALLAAWVMLGRYTRTETARGLLVTDSASAKVIAIRPGLVTELLVREGDLVRPGQRLATIRVEQSSDSGASAVAESLGAIDAQRGLTGEQVRIAGARAESERRRIAAALAGLRRQRADLEPQLALQQDAVASAQGLFERLQGVADKGFVSRVEVERRRQAWIAAREDLARLVQQHNALAAQEEGAAAELARVQADRSSEIVTAQVSAETLAQRRAELESQRAYAVTAPVGGRVAALQVAAGRTAEPGIPLMEIVPQGSALHAEVYAPTRAIGFVRPGQEVRLLYDAFPYQRFGSFRGRIVRVSSTVLDPRQLAEPLKIDEPVYRIEVRPAAQQLEAYGERLPLQPGMALTASIVLDRRSFLDWLLQPLDAVLRRNGEENGR